MAQPIETVPQRRSLSEPTLAIPVDVRRRLTELAREGYPEEVCGLIVGTPGARRTRVERITSARNLAAQRRADRYVLDPDDFLHADVAARAAGLEIVGIWHTHPDHPARPSATDLAMAWWGYTYLILSVRRGGVTDLSAWRLDCGRFVEQRVQEVTS